MADTKISALTELTAGQIAPTTDVLPIVDTSATTTKKITATNTINDTISSVINGRSTETDILANDDFLPVYDTSASSLDKALVRNVLIPNNRNIIYFSDFLVGGQGFGPYTSAFSGTGSTSGSGGVGIDATHIGSNLVTMGTTAGSYSYIGTDNNCMLLGGGVWIFESVVRVANLSDATDTYSLRAGFGDGLVGSESTNGVAIRYTHGTNSGAWQGYTVASSTETTVNSAVTVAANTWYKLRIEINAAASSVEFFVDGVSIGTSSTNIPSAVMGFIAINIRRTAGTTNARTAYVDYTYIFHQLTAAR